MKIRFKNFNIGLFDKSNRTFVYGICLIVALTIIVVFVSVFNNGSNTYLLQMQNIEHTSLANGYVIKKETIIQRDSNKSLVPVIAEGRRVSKGGTIATYKNEEYDAKLKELESLDKEILELMQNLPAVYSGEIESIENQIRSELKAALGTTSYVEMQNYINKINSMVNKRASVVGQMSPSGETIKKLISKRNEFEDNMKKSSDNVITTTSGIVMYNTDGLEETLSADNISTIDYEFAKEAVFNKVPGSNIKIIDNFHCYIVARTDIVSEDYLTTGREYKLRIVGDTQNELEATLISYTIDKDAGILDITLQIENGIELIAETREIEFEIVWLDKNGWLAKNESIYYKEEIPFVQVIRYGKIIEIPVKIEYSNDASTIVNNLSDDAKEQLGIKETENLKLYDNVILRRESK